MRDRVERLLEVHEAHIEWLLMLACLVHQYSFWHPSLFQQVSRLGSVTAWKLCGVEQRVPPIFGRAAITLGIGPHSSILDRY